MHYLDLQTAACGYRTGLRPLGRRLSGAALAALLVAGLCGGCRPKQEEPAVAPQEPARQTNPPAGTQALPPSAGQSVAFPNGSPMMPREMPGGTFSRRTPVVEAVEKAIPSVVNIGTERMVQTVYSDQMMSTRQQLLDQFFRDFFGAVPQPRQPKVRMTQSLGSGVVVDERGYILTNFHVIDRASRVRVMFDDDQTYDATFVAGDEVNDIALIKIHTGSNRLPKAIEFADNDELLLGETVIAMGNPYGLSHSVTMGVLSATNREASYRGQVLYRDILQTDAAVNPGNSGGPLVNIEGKLIGVNVAIFQQAQNIGFALPVRRVRQFLGRWMSPQHLRGEWLGFETAWDGSSVRVSYVDASSPAHAAGLRPGATITAIEGRPTQDHFAFNRQLLALPPGADVQVTWTLGGEMHTSRLTMLALPNARGNDLAYRRLGFTLHTTVGKAVAPARFEKCLPIESLRENGPAARIGLEPGRYITRINEYDIRNLDDVATALRDVQRGDVVTLALVDFSEREFDIIAHQSYVQLIAE